MSGADESLDPERPSTPTGRVAYAGISGLAVGFLTPALGLLIWVLVAGWSLEARLGWLYATVIGVIALAPTLLRSPTHAGLALVSLLWGASVRLFGLLFAFLAVGSTEARPTPVLLFCVAVLAIMTVVDGALYMRRCSDPEESHGA